MDLVRRKFERISPYLDEQTRRIWAATEAVALSHGGIETVSKATGIARSTIGRGIEELDSKSRSWRSRARSLRGFSGS